MKKRLIIISDLWGIDKSDWLINYSKILESKFSITFYDSCELAEIEQHDLSKEDIHKKIINGGIKTAIENLRKLEKHPVNILAFSIGGTIGWNYGLETQKINNLTCVSSTRLRKETKKPNGNITLLYGEKDAYKPDNCWFKDMDIHHKTLTNHDHSLYTEPEFAKWVSEELIKTY